MAFAASSARPSAKRITSNSLPSGTTQRYIIRRETSPTTFAQVKHKRISSNAGGSIMFDARSFSLIIPDKEQPMRKNDGWTTLDRVLYDAAMLLVATIIIYSILMVNWPL